jgi:hypothetical protein
VLSQPFRDALSRRWEEVGEGWLVLPQPCPDGLSREERIRKDRLVLPPKSPPRDEALGEGQGRGVRGRTVCDIAWCARGSAALRYAHADCD